MTKLVYLDVGTHFGQEFQSLFGKRSDFLLKVARRFVGYYVLRRGEKISITDMLYVNTLRKRIKKVEKDFIFFFVEANSRIINHSDVYKKAHGVFNCALTDTSNVNIAKLFLANGDELGQGSSIFLNKKNVSIADVIPTLGLSSNLFFDAFKRHLDTITDDYVLIIRLNCEGVEDDVIYAAHKIFKDKLVLTMGSLKDVKVIKGTEAYEDLENYLKDNSIPFVFFSSSVSSWKKAHSSIQLLHSRYE